MILRFTAPLLVALALLGCAALDRQETHAGNRELAVSPPVAAEMDIVAPEPSVWTIWGSGLGT
jgi:hypothetical protein